METKNKKPVIDVDKECRSIFIIFKKSKAKESETVYVSGGIQFIIDRDEKGEVMAIEILY